MSSVGHLNTPKTPISKIKNLHHWNIQFFEGMKYYYALTHSPSDLTGVEVGRFQANESLTKLKAFSYMGSTRII